MRIKLFCEGSRVRVLSEGALKHVVGTIRKIKTYADAKGVRRVAHVSLGGGRRQTFALEAELEAI